MIKKTSLICSILFVILLSGCQSQTETQSSSNTLKKEELTQTSDNNEDKKVALDDAQVQNDNKKISTRVITNGTKIKLTVGDVIIPATLNDSKASKQLISMLPYTVKMNRYSHDYCGVMDEPLEYDESDVHYGWLNGDIDFARDADYFTILFEDEEVSESFGHQINLGKIDGDLSQIKDLGSSVEMLIELE